VVKVHDSEDVANHAGPESCGAHREVCTEALIGDTGRLGIEPRNHTSKTPMPFALGAGSRVRGLEHGAWDGRYVA
jgi:hypothetical protein